jgi:hypothetical protein
MVQARPLRFFRSLQSMSVITVIHRHAAVVIPVYTAAGEQKLHIWSTSSNNSSSPCLIHARDRFTTKFTIQHTPR